MVFINKITVTLLAMIIGTTVAYETEVLIAKEEWEVFKTQHGKHYDSIVEDHIRMQIFMENKFRVMNHNELYALNKTTYTMDINHLSDMLPREVTESMQGLLGDRDKYPGSNFISPEDEIFIPNHIDWRLKGVVTPVKSQGACGSCWAFSAVGSLEGQHARKTRHLINLSEQNLVDCCHLCKGCEGGSMPAAFKCIYVEGGIESEFNYPYTAHDGKCKFDQRKVAANVTGWMNVQRNERALQKAVAVVGPISVGIDACSSFMHYHSGIYYDPNCSPTHLNHGVLIVGYGTERGMDYWLVKNSWGIHWGDHGYIKMARNRSNMCGIASFASFPLV